MAFSPIETLSKYPKKRDKSRDEAYSSNSKPDSHPEAPAAKLHVYYNQHKPRSARQKICLDVNEFNLWSWI